MTKATDAGVTASDIDLRHTFGVVGASGNRDDSYFVAGDALTISVFTAAVDGSSTKSKLVLLVLWLLLLLLFKLLSEMPFAFVVAADAVVAVRFAKILLKFIFSLFV